jgi:NitT/TauT family transport system substrate-binding protein
MQWLCQRPWFERSRLAIVLMLAAHLAATGAAMGAATGTASAQTPAAPLKKTQLGIGTLVLNLTYPWALMPPVLGYWREEGYEVEVFAAQSSLQAIQVMSAGKVDFIEANSAPIMQAAANNNIPIRTIMVNTVIDWSLVSPAGSPIHKVADFKGKVIGLSSLGTGGVALLKSYLGANGLNPDADVTMVAVGVGPAALGALRTDRVQGLMFWGSAITGFEAAGAKFDHFFDPNWRKYADFSIATLQSTIDRDPAMVVALVRGAAKASLFAMTNPDCVRKLQWAKYPDTKPTGASEETLIEADLYRLKGQQDSMQQALEMGGGKLWGRATPQDFATLEDFFIATKIVNKKLGNPADYLVGIPNFFEKVNDFDHDAVIRQAKECRSP